MKILSVVGARPNFMKIAPFVKAINESNAEHQSQLIDHLLVHTGQHYDDRMSKQFFYELNIPEADINLGVGSGSHAEQVGHTMIEFEKVLRSEKPDWVVVVGDVNATLACSVTAKKELVKCCHIEAGLRSGDLTMPEEINRLVTDRLCDLLLTPDKIANENLHKEGASDSKIKFVGNIMIDTLDANFLGAKSKQLSEIIVNNLFDNVKASDYEIEDEQFAVMTLHRPSNVDIKEVFSSLIDFVTNIVARDLLLIWPIHPRAAKQLQLFDLWNKVTESKNIVLTKPLGYIDMLRLNMGARVMLTDSGGLQEECTVLGTPCLTLRCNTERPVTLKKFGGASVLVGNDIDAITREYNLAVSTKRVPCRPELWDGKTAKRCLEAILVYDRTIL